MKLITFKVSEVTYKSFKKALKDIDSQEKSYTLNGKEHVRKGKYVDLLRPCIEKFIEAASNNKGQEFIDYIKSWPKN